MELHSETVKSDDFFKHAVADILKPLLRTTAISLRRRGNNEKYWLEVEIL